MARLLVEGESYDRLSSAAFLEREYEALILAGADGFFPGLEVVRFKTPVVHETETRLADLALIDRSYRRWWVGEVERADHSLERHVLPQVEVLARGAYGEEHAAALAAGAPQLEAEALRRMMRGAQPQVAVIVNAPCPAWEQPLRREGAALVVIEVFRSGRDRLIYRQNGAELSPGDDVISLCYADPVMPRMLVVEAPARLPAPSAEALTIEFGGGVTRWRVIESEDRSWLSPLRGSPFPHAAGGFTLVRGAGGRLRFEPIERQRRRRRGV